MRPAPVAGVTMLLTVVCAAPATADPLPDALASVDAACDATRAALVNSGGVVVDGDRSVILAGDRFAVSGPGFNRVAVAGEGTYGRLSDDGLRSKDRKAALRYIRARATWWLNPGVFWSPAMGWSASFEESAGASVLLPQACGQELATAVAVERSAGRWIFTLPDRGPVVVTEDAEGRLTQFGSVSVSFGPQTVSVPTGAIGFATWQKASQAASLNATMKRTSRAVASAVNAAGATVAGIDAATRAAVPTDRVVPLRVRQLRRGVLIYGRNPYTKTYHAWRVYLKAGKAVARRVAP
ncbi:MAG: hypothetical protein H6526_08520 [Actinobacteria bacterium]|nr:hypothetical protein [Actinomycetota bacterium]MCB8997106.1 hypothetical protein [Actinomycetota bacterium]MCB9415315.1 hypothetical protein [Actinomycetota bacterium]MCB9424809.1 hypothetical protein [Actinomycetota bacterium]HRY09441.1 hypothetical protein [Candidatus Nanopelagicales bacterium]